MAWRTQSPCYTQSCWQSRASKSLPASHPDIVNWLLRRPPRRLQSERMCFGAGQEACAYKSLCYELQSASWHAQLALGNEDADLLLTRIRVAEGMFATVGNVSVHHENREEILLDSSVLLVDRADHMPHLAESLLPVLSFPLPIDHIIFRDMPCKSTGCRPGQAGHWGDWQHTVVRTVQERLLAMHGRRVTVSRGAAKTLSQ